MRPPEPVVSSQLRVSLLFQKSDAKELKEKVSKLESSLAEREAEKTQMMAEADTLATYYKDLEDQHRYFKALCDQLAVVAEGCEKCSQQIDRCQQEATRIASEPLQPATSETA